MYQWSWLSFGPLHSRCSCQTLNKRKRFRVSEGINVHFLFQCILLRFLFTLAPGRPGSPVLPGSPLEPFGPEVPVIPRSPCAPLDEWEQNVIISSYYLLYFAFKVILLLPSGPVSHPDQGNHGFQEPPKLDNKTHKECMRFWRLHTFLSVVAKLWREN